jgi:predicted nucleic acid-binding protein
LEVITRNPLAVSETSDYVERGLEIVLGIQKLEILSVERFHIQGLITFMRYSLLPRDALHLSVMSAVRCRDIASIDEDFDKVPEIVRWAPL